MALTPATLRADLKCGKGSISEGEKCSKGAVSKAGRTEALKTAGKVALVAGALAGGALGGKMLLQNAANKAQRSNKIKLRNMNMVRQSKWAEVWATNKKVNEAGFFKRGKAQANYQGARDRLYETMSLQKQQLARMKRFAPKSEARKRAGRRRDSVWAEGFEP